MLYIYIYIYVDFYIAGWKESNSHNQLLDNTGKNLIKFFLKKTQATLSGNCYLNMLHTFLSDVYVTHNDTNAYAFVTHYRFEKPLNIWSGKK